jgi:murein DD-endopeptidase MepM/ murein hydrolase activator NlpD
LRVRQDQAMGRHILVRSGPFKLVFAHLDSVAVSRGDRVEKGALLGHMGRSGRVTGPHLHLELHRRGRTWSPSLALLGCPAPS